MTSAESPLGRFLEVEHPHLVIHHFSLVVIIHFVCIWIEEKAMQEKINLLKSFLD